MPLTSLKSYSTCTQLLLISVCWPCEAAAYCCCPPLSDRNPFYVSSGWSWTCCVTLAALSFESFRLSFWNAGITGMFDNHLCVSDDFGIQNKEMFCSLLGECFAILLSVLPIHSTHEVPCVLSKVPMFSDKWFVLSQWKLDLFWAREGKVNILNL